MITKAPGDAFGGAVAFYHKGPAMTVNVGIALAYSGYSTPFSFADLPVALESDATPTRYTVTLLATVPSDTTPGNVDALVYIGKSFADLSNPYGVNFRDSNVYQVAAPSTPTPTPTNPLVASYLAQIAAATTFDQLTSILNAFYWDYFGGRISYAEYMVLYDAYSARWYQL